MEENKSIHTDSDTVFGQFQQDAMIYRYMDIYMSLPGRKQQHPH